MAVKAVDTSDLADEPLAYDPEDDGKSDLDLLAADIEQKIAEPTRLVHPGREGYVLIFRSHIDSGEALSCQKRAKNAKDPVVLGNAMLLALASTGLEKNGQPVENSKGQPVTFRDPELLAALKVRTAADAVAKFIGNDGYLIALTDAVMTAAGYGAEVEVARDPTQSD